VYASSGFPRSPLRRGDDGPAEPAHDRGQHVVDETLSDAEPFTFTDRMQIGLCVVCPSSESRILAIA
jgi:hypothetical protein